MRYIVQAYPIVRVTVVVDAPTAVEAAKKADRQVNYHQLFNAPGCEYAGAGDGYTVDGDDGGTVKLDACFNVIHEEVQKA